MKEHGIIHKRSQGLIDFAYEYAKKAHGDQKRKYTGEPYITHPVAVAKIVMTTNPDCEMIAAAILHDVIEDTERTYDDICDAGFREGIATLVTELSDVSRPEDGVRHIRKAIDREHLAGVSDRAKTIKLADLIHNTGSRIKYGKGFAPIYMNEKRLLLDVLVGGDEGLMRKARKLVDDYFEITPLQQ